MKRAVIILALLILSLSLVSANGEDNVDWEESFGDILAIDTTGLTEEEIVELQKDTLFSNFDQIQEIYNAQDFGLPNFVTNVFGTQRMNIELEGDYNVVLVTEDAKIIEFREGEIDNPTMLVSISDQVFLDFYNDQLDLMKALDEKEITYEGVGVINKVKVGFLRTSYNIFSLFG